MSNDTIVWLMFFAPWLTLFFMQTKEVKHWLPVAFLATILATIIHDIGTALGFWTVTYSVYPFNQLSPYFFGTMPVLTIWVFKLTYGRFERYMLVNGLLDIGFNFIILGYFLPLRGIMTLNIPPLYSLPITLIHAAAIYAYQKWQEEAHGTEAAYTLRPAAAKPLDEDGHTGDRPEKQ